MAYAVTNPPHLISQLIGGVRKVFRYDSADDAATVDASGYITDGYQRGMRAGDTVFSTDTNETNSLTSGHTVVTSNATTGAVDLSNGITIGGGSNSD